MIHSEHPFAEGTAWKFPTERGTVWALVRPKGRGRASLDIYEQETALAAHRNPRVIVERGESPEEVSARNRFGTGIMLRICRFLKSEYAWVREWTYERVSGSNPGRQKVRV